MANVLSMSSRRFPYFSRVVGERPSCIFRLVCKEFRNCALLPNNINLAFDFNQPTPEANVKMCSKYLTGLYKILSLPQNENTTLQFDFTTSLLNVLPLLSSKFFGPPSVFTFSRNLQKLTIPFPHAPPSPISDGIRYNISQILASCLSLKDLTLQLGAFAPWGELHPQFLLKDHGNRLERLQFQQSSSLLTPLPFLSPLGSFSPALLI